MQTLALDLPMLAFESIDALHAWLLANHATSPGIWVQLKTRASGLPSVTFAELLDEGLCFGWSERMRRKGDATSYLQRFTPRKAKGTQSARNQARIAHLKHAGRMTPAGLAVLDLSGLICR